MAGFNLLVRLNYMLFFVTVLKFIAGVDPNFGRAAAALYRISTPDNAKETLNAAWPYGFGTFLHFITGIVLTLNLYVMQQMLDHPDQGHRPDIMDNYCFNTGNNQGICSTTNYRSPSMPQRLFATSDNTSNSRSSHVADYIRESAPKKFPQTEGKISFTFPEPSNWIKNVENSNTDIPKAHNEIVLLPEEQLDQLESVNQPDNQETNVANDVQGIADADHEDVTQESLDMIPKGSADINPMD